MEGGGVTETEPHTAAEGYEQGRAGKKSPSHMKHVDALVFDAVQ